MNPTVGSLFAGIGGIDLGFERAGFITSWQVEIDPWARKVLAKNFPKAERYGDIRDCGRHNLTPVDVVVGGFPCQDISNAGLRAGIEGERSGLWTEMHRIIGELRPRFVLVENVAALLGRGMGRVLGDLSEIGYDAEWEVVSAADVGAPHLRERVWILAYPDSGRRRSELAGGYDANGSDARWPEANGVLGAVCNSGAARYVAYAESDLRGASGHERSATPHWSGANVADARSGRRGKQSSRQVEQSRGAEAVGGCEAVADAGRAGIHERWGAASLSANDGPGRSERDGLSSRSVQEGTQLAHANDDDAQGKFAGRADASEWRGQEQRQAGSCAASCGGQRIAESGVGVLADGLPAGMDGSFWLTEPDIPRVAKNVRDRVNQLRGLGNAVVPQIPELYARRIRALLAADQQRIPPHSVPAIQSSSRSA